MMDDLLDGFDAPPSKSSKRSRDADSDSGGAARAKKEKEPNMEQVVYIGGRKGYLQTQNVEVFW